MALLESCITIRHGHICECLCALWSFAGVLYNMKKTKICAGPRHHRVAAGYLHWAGTRWLKMYKFRIHHNKMALLESCITTRHGHVCTCLCALWSFTGVLYNMKKKETMCQAATPPSRGGVPAQGRYPVA